MNKEIEVSIITPSYNSEDFIRATLDSVLNQTFDAWELIIVDDMSTDNSVKIVKDYINRYPNNKIKLIQNKKNLRAALSRNEAIKLAEGRFIAFLDSDDLWKPVKLDEQITFMKDNNYVFTCSYFDQINEEGDYIGSVTDIPLKITYNYLLKANKIGCLTSVYDTAFFGKVYMDNIAKRQDYGLWLKLLKKTDFAHCYPKVLADYRIRKNSVSSNKVSLIKYHWFIYYKHENLGLFKSMYLTVSYVIRTLIN